MHVPQTSLGSVGVPALGIAGLGLNAGRRAKVDAGMVHDLGNLLQVVTSAFNILAREVPSVGAPRLAQAIESARGTLDRASALVRQSLRVARDAAVDQAPIDLARCLIALEPTLRSTCGSAIMVEVSAGSGRAVLLCNRTAFESVVLALSRNARDAMPQGGVLSIASGSDDYEIFVRIADTGPGTPPAVRPQAIETAPSPADENGLAVASRFVAAIGGRMDVETTAGDGTALTLTFPNPARNVVS